MSEFTERIASILREKPAGGGHTEEIVLPDWNVATHRFSLATGFLWLERARRYRQTFGDPPRWVLAYHPYHRASMCMLALQHGEPLPFEPPCSALKSAESSQCGDKKEERQE